MLIELDRPIEIPAVMDDDTELIFGTPCFAVIGQIELMRMAGEQIPHKAEAEQAAYIHFCLAARQKFGQSWSKDAMALLRERIAARDAEYIRSLKPGERVVETTRGSERSGKQGTVYVSENPGPSFGSTCVKWDDGLGTAATHGTRRIAETT